MSQDKLLQDRRVLVTGGSRGLGRALCVALAEAGARVAFSYQRNDDAAADTLTRIQAAGRDGMSFKTSVLDVPATADMVGRIEAAWGGVDILVNNAGTTRFVPLPEIDELVDEDWDRILQLNVKGAFYATRACVPSMRLRGGGLVVNVASIAGYTGAGSSIPYAVSKGAMITMTRSLAKALAPDIRVNAVAPGIVTTRWVAGHEDHVQRYAKETPLGRAATAEDVALVIVSFATHGTFLTGEVTIVDGGREMR